MMNDSVLYWRTSVNNDCWRKCFMNNKYIGIMIWSIYHLAFWNRCQIEVLGLNMTNRLKISQIVGQTMQWTRANWQIQIRLNIEQHKPHKKPCVHSGAPEGYVVPALLRKVNFRERYSKLHIMSRCWFFKYSNEKNGIGGIMVSVLASSAVDRGFEPWSGQTKDYTFVIVCFSAKHAVLRGKYKDWLARNLDKVSEWGRHVYPRIVVSVN